MESLPFLGVIVNGYTITQQIYKGEKRAVFLGENHRILDKKAIKITKEEDVNPQWENEITKATRLQNIDGIVRFHSDSTVMLGGTSYICTLWDYIPSQNLQQINDSGNMTIPLIADVVDCTLTVMHACQKCGFMHGDLHLQNILIEDPNPLSADIGGRKVWVTDFSCEEKSVQFDDFKALARIITLCLDGVNIHELDKDDRIKYRALRDEFPKLLLEQDPTIGVYAQNPLELKAQLAGLYVKDMTSATYKKNAGDFLAAELIGERYDEWKALFVPSFFAAEELLDKNPCVLTGMRGCGKTMIFRRLSAELQEKLGKANIPGEDSFVGFYLNARHLAEAFPWLPDSYEEQARPQIINFFHLKWIIALLEWLAQDSKKFNYTNWSWLNGFFIQTLDSAKVILGTGENAIFYLLSHFYGAIQECKISNRYNNRKEWKYTAVDFLEDFVGCILKNYPYIGGRAFYFFLDDYSMPLVKETTQKILNPIIFRRTPNLFFKVSTESIESFLPRGLNGKFLEVGADYKLIDLAMESMTRQQPAEISEMIGSIFTRRMERDERFRGKNISVVNLLGGGKFNNTDIARQLIKQDADGQMEEKQGSKRVYYCGFDVLCNMWTSDIRELIKIFAKMLDKTEKKDIEERIKRFEAMGILENPIIDKSVQDGILREAGGQFLQRLASANSPEPVQELASMRTDTYGSHLLDIVTSLQQLAHYELVNKTSGNQGGTPPKQARRIELKSTNGKLTLAAEIYYKGLIRYGVLIRDSRGKSVNGKAATRLYLRGLLIPYFRITFSKRDSIMMDWDDLDSLLVMPQEYTRRYIANGGGKNKKDAVIKELPGQIQMQIDMNKEGN